MCPDDKTFDPRIGVRSEMEYQKPGHDIRIEQGELVYINNGYTEKIEAVKHLWATTHKNKPLSIAVRLGMEAAEVCRILGLESYDEDGYDGLTWSPEEAL